MAYVAETVGAQPISFMDGAGEVMAGAKEAAVLYGAQQKAETMKLELENARIKQDGMKAGIFLDYMDKIKNAPNPTVKKILERQYAAQHEKMYGQPMDAETLKAITESPDFGSTLQNLIQGMGIDGAGKEYANMVNQLATALGLPYVDAQKVMKQAFDYYIEEKRAKLGASAAAARLGISSERLDMAGSKMTQSGLKEAEEDKQVNEFSTQLTGANKGLGMIQKAINAYRESGGTKTITYGQFSEILTDIAALQAIKPGAVIPIAREKKLSIDVGKFSEAIAEFKTNITDNPSKTVPIDNIKLVADQISTIKGILRVAYERELKKGYSRGVAAGTIPKDVAERRFKEVLSDMDTELIKALELSGQAKSMTPRQMIESGMSYYDIKAKIDKDPRYTAEQKAAFTQEKYNSAVNQMKANKK